MNELDFEFNKEYYTKLTLESTDNLHSESWGVQQDFRYEELTTKDFYDGRSVLEIGCGTGGFLEYIISKGFRSDYCGIDIVPEMQKHNEEKWPQYRFLTLDVLNSDFDDKYDIVVFCGVFNIQTNDPDNYMKALLSRGIWVMQLCA